MRSSSWKQTRKVAVSRYRDLLCLELERRYGLDYLSVKCVIFFSRVPLLTLTVRTSFLFTASEFCLGRLESSGVQEDLTDCSWRSGLFYGQDATLPPRTCPCK